MQAEPAPIESIKNAIYSEILGVIGKRDSRFADRLLRLCFGVPVGRISEMLVAFERDVNATGLNAAVNRLLSRFVSAVRIAGPVDVPEEGPLIVAANHPGSYDALILAALIPRDDLMIMTSTMPFINCLPSVAPHFIFVGKTPHSKMAAFRAALRHLKDGKALLVFPRGNVEPDPALSSGAEGTLKEWSPSVGMMLSKAPQASAVVAIVRGVISARWLNNPVFRFLKKPEQRQKMAEIAQVAGQLMLSRKTSLDPAVSFSPPVSQSNPGCSTPETWLDIVQRMAREQYHLLETSAEFTTVRFST